VLIESRKKKVRGQSKKIRLSQGFEGNESFPQRTRGRPTCKVAKKSSKKKRNQNWRALKNGGQAITGQKREQKSLAKKKVKKGESEYCGERQTPEGSHHN